jgi:plastocyanin
MGAHAARDCDGMKNLAFAAVFLVPLAAFAADAAHTIVQKGRRFNPGEVTIGRGESLTFTNDDEFIHQIYVESPDFSFDSDEKNPGELITETFTQSGTFQVRCHIHPKMRLMVHVR